jgi:hypothetical protein
MKMTENYEGMTDWLANESSPWYRDFPEKSNVDQLVKEYTGFMEPIKFIMVFTNTCNLTLF